MNLTTTEGAKEKVERQNRGIYVYKELVGGGDVIQDHLQDDRQKLEKALP
jgi:glutaredoxin-related protein